MSTITVRELHANVSDIIARVQGGEVLTLTRRGMPVVELRLPAPRKLDDPAWRDAYDKSLAFLKTGLPLGGGRITEDDKYGDDDL